MNKSLWNIPLILKRMLEFMLVFSLVFIIALPFLVSYLGSQEFESFFSGNAQNKWLTFLFLEITCICCWFILLFLHKLMKTVINSKPFVFDNVKYLKYISYLCAAAALILIIKTFIDFSVLTPVVAVVAMLSSLFCQTLAAVFDKAIRIKDENDLTI